MVNLCNTRALLAILAMMVGAGLTGCGGEDAFTSGGANGTGNGGGTGVPGSGAQTGTVANIAITYPYTDAVLKFGAGLYQRKGTAFVTDVDGNTVPDGTEVILKVIDSIKVRGTIDSGSADSISGAVLTDNGATLGDGVTATSFDAAYVSRNGTSEFISSQDQVFLIPSPLLPEGTPAGFKADMARSVASHTGATLTVTNSYANVYPNVTYPTGTTAYVVGGSHIGVEVAGVDEAGVATTGIGSTIDGAVNFKITYPANPGTLGVGCIANDPRYLPAGSADIYLMASNSSGSVATIDEPCLARIAGGTLASTVDSIGVDTTSFYIQFKDGGDLIPVPFNIILPSWVSTAGSPTVTFNGTTGGVYTTDDSGWINPNVTVAGVSGDKATIKFTVASEPSVSVEVSVVIP